MNDSGHVGSESKRKCLRLGKGPKGLRKDPGVGCTCTADEMVDWDRKVLTAKRA